MRLTTIPRIKRVSLARPRLRRPRIPERFEPSKWHEDRIAEARTELSRLECMRADEAEQEAMSAWQKDEEIRKKHLAENVQLIANYDRLAARVEAWAPPSPDHDGLRKFMLEQLSESRKFDCQEEYLVKPAQNLTGIEWLEAKKRRALRDIEYHAGEHLKELQRTEDRNRWIKQLRDSLDTEVSHVTR